MTAPDKRPSQLEPCPMGRTDYEACFAPFRYCPVKGCGRTEPPAAPFAPEATDLYNALWEWVEHRREAITTAQDARNICEDEHILTTHIMEVGTCPTCDQHREGKVCHPCGHVPLNRCEWLRSLARRHFTGNEPTVAKAGEQ